MKSVMDVEPSPKVSRGKKGKPTASGSSRYYCYGAVSSFATSNYHESSHDIDTRDKVVHGIHGYDIRGESSHTTFVTSEPRHPVSSRLGSPVMSGAEVVRVATEAGTVGGSGRRCAQPLLHDALDLEALVHEPVGQVAIRISGVCIIHAHKPSRLFSSPSRRGQISFPGSRKSGS